MSAQNEFPEDHLWEQTAFENGQGSYKHKLVPCLTIEYDRWNDGSWLLHYDPFDLSLEEELGSCSITIERGYLHDLMPAFQTLVSQLSEKLEMVAKL